MRRVYWGLRLLAVVWVATVAAAQETRSVIQGLVLDPQGAAIIGAVVVVTNTNTNILNSVTTNETGHYEANFLMAGNYRVTVEMAGFKTAVRSGIELPVSTRAEIDVVLEIGAGAETVSVTAEAPLVDASSLSAWSRSASVHRGAAIATRTTRRRRTPRRSASNSPIES